MKLVNNVKTNTMTVEQAETITPSNIKISESKAINTFNTETTQPQVEEIDLDSLFSKNNQTKSSVTIETPSNTNQDINVNTNSLSTNNKTSNTSTQSTSTNVNTSSFNTSTSQNTTTNTNVDINITPKTSTNSQSTTTSTNQNENINDISTRNNIGKTANTSSIQPNISINTGKSATTSRTNTTTTTNNSETQQAQTSVNQQDISQAIGSAVANAVGPILSPIVTQPIVNTITRVVENINTSSTPSITSRYHYSNDAVSSIIDIQNLDYAALTAEQIANFVGQFNHEQYNEFIAGMENYYDSQADCLRGMLNGTDTFMGVQPLYDYLYNYDEIVCGNDAINPEHITLNNIEMAHESLQLMWQNLSIHACTMEEINAQRALIEEYESIVNQFISQDSTLAEYGVTNYNELIELRTQLYQMIPQLQYGISLNEQNSNSAKFDYLNYLQDFNDYEFPREFSDRELGYVEDSRNTTANEYGTDNNSYNYNEFHEAHPRISPVSYMLMLNELHPDGDYTVIGLPNNIETMVNAIEYYPNIAKTYEYLYDQDESDAEDYVEACEYEFVQIEAQLQANEFLNMLGEMDGNENDFLEALGNEFGVAGAGVIEGLNSFVEGCGYTLEAITTGTGLTEENREQSVSELRRMYIIQALYGESNRESMGLICQNENGEYVNTDPNSIIDYTKNYFINFSWDTASNIGAHTYQIGQGIGNMLPSIALSQVCPLAGSIALGISAGGNAYHTAMVGGHSYLSSVMYGIVSGASESVSERILGGLPGLSETEVTSLRTYLASVARESNQEMFQGVMDAAYQAMFMGESLPPEGGWQAFAEDILQQGIYGGITAGILNMPSLTHSATTVNQLNQTRQQLNISEDVYQETLNNIRTELGDEHFSLNDTELQVTYANAINLQMQVQAGNISQDAYSNLIHNFRFNYQTERGQGIRSLTNLEIENKYANEILAVMNLTRAGINEDVAILMQDKNRGITLEQADLLSKLKNANPDLDIDSISTDLMNQMLLHPKIVDNIIATSNSQINIDNSSYAVEAGTGSETGLIVPPEQGLSVPVGQNTTSTITDEQYSLLDDLFEGIDVDESLEETEPQSSSIEEDNDLEDEDDYIPGFPLLSSRPRFTQRECCNFMVRYLESLDESFIEMSASDIEDMIHVEEGFFTDPECIDLIHRKLDLELRLSQLITNAYMQQLNNPSNSVPQRAIDMLSQELQTQVRDAARVIYDNAVDQAETIDEDMRQFEDGRAQLIGIENHIKSLEKIEDKIARWVSNGYDVAFSANQINDSLRYTFIINEDRYEDYATAILLKLVQQGYVIREEYCNDAWGKPTYQGLNITLESPNHDLVEIQFHTETSFHTKEDLNHEFYEISRNPAMSPEIRRLSEEIQSINQRLYVENVGFGFSYDTIMEIARSTNKIRYTNISSQNVFDELSEEYRRQHPDCEFVPGTNIPVDLVISDIAYIRELGNGDLLAGINAIATEYGVYSIQAITARSLVLREILSNSEVGNFASRIDKAKYIAQLYSQIGLDSYDNTIQMNEEGLDIGLSSVCTTFLSEKYAHDIAVWERIRETWGGLDGIEYFTSDFSYSGAAHMRTDENYTAEEIRVIRQLSSQFDRRRTDGFTGMQERTIIYRGFDDISWLGISSELRGQSLVDEINNNLRLGITDINDNAFSSATPILGQGFTQEFTSKIIEVCSCPPGTEGAYIAGFSSYGIGEVEYTYQAGSGNRKIILGVQEIDGQVFIFTEYIPDAAARIATPKIDVEIPSFESQIDLQNHISSLDLDTNLDYAAEVLLKYISDRASDSTLSDALYYEFINVSNLEIDEDKRARLLTQVINSSVELRTSIYNSALEELESVFSSRFGINHEKCKTLLDYLLGKNFIEDGIGAGIDWEQFSNSLAIEIQSKVQESILSGKEPVIWSSFDDEFHDVMDSVYTTVSNTSIGGLSFLESVYTNWNSDVTQHKAYTLWSYISDQFVRSCCLARNADGNRLSAIRFLYPSTSKLEKPNDLFGEIFRHSELPQILESGTIETIIMTRTNPSDMSIVETINIDITDIIEHYNEELFPSSDTIDECYDMLIEKCRKYNIFISN